MGNNFLNKFYIVRYKLIFDSKHVSKAYFEGLTILTNSEFSLNKLKIRTPYEESNLFAIPVSEINF